MDYLLTDQETERLIFRMLQRDDFDAWLPLFQTENIAKFFDMTPGLSELEMCEKWFDKAFHRYENDLGGMNVMIEKRTGLMVGQCGLLIQNIEGVERLEIGYSVLPAFQGKGFALEAAAKCKHFGFENNFAEVLMSMVHVDNISSEKVAIRNGMTFEKKVKEFNIFSIHKNQWEAQKLRV